MTPERRDLLHRLALVASTGGGALLTMVWMAWAGRALGPEAASDFYGAVFLIFTVYMLGHPLNGVTARFAALWTAQGETDRVWPLYAWTLRWLLVAGGLTLLVLALALGPLADALRFREPWALGFGIMAAWLALAVSAARGVLRGAGRLPAFAANVLLEAALRLGVGLGVLAAVASASAAMSAYVVAGLAAWLAAHLLVRRQRGAGALPDTRTLFAYAGPMVLMSLADAAFQNVDVLLAKRTLAADVAGRYGAVATLTRALGVIVQPFALLVIPLLTTRHARGEAVGRTLAGLTAAFLALAALPMVAFVLWPRPLLELIYGPAYSSAAPWLAGHAVATLATFVSLMLAQAFAAVARFSFLWLYGAGAVTLTAALLLGPADPAAYVRAQVVVKLCVVAGVAVWWGVGLRRGARATPQP